MTASTRIALIGFGEVGQVLASDLLARGSSDVIAWDIKFGDASSAPSRAIEGIGAQRAGSAGEAVSQADLIISAVTAAEDLAAAHSVAAHIRAEAFYVDVNSVSPGVKKQVAGVISEAGGRYVEAAIMSPISPKRIAAPILLGGVHAATFLPLAQQLGFSGAEVFSDELGRASAAKMCRSVIVKGMEALLTESMLAARHYGVEQNVLESLQGLLRTESWPALARYMISRSLVHGRRRAEEMREVARTVEETGVDAWMSSACAQRQDWAAAHGKAAEYEELEAMLDAILRDAGKGQ